jgi:hypothetical protein
MGVDAMMYVELKEGMDKLAVRRAAAELSEAFGESRFFIQRDNSRHALNDIADSEYPEDAECFNRPGVAQWLRVSLWTRYYGEGYERGDFGLLYMIALWLEARFPGAVILYGGDCDDEYPLFDKARRDELFAHWVKNGGRPYRGGWGKAPACDFCGGYPMTNCGGGNGQEFISCGGCGYKGIRDNGVLREIEGEFFDRKYKKVPVSK